MQFIAKGPIVIKFRPYSIIAVGILLLFSTLPATACATTSAHTLTLDERLQTAHLVCVARVIDKPDPISTRLGDWNPLMDSMYADRTVLRQPLVVEVLNVLTGQFELSTTITIYSMFSGYVQHVTPGSNYLLCLYWSPYFLDGCYVIRERNDVLEQRAGNYYFADGVEVREDQVQIALNEVSLDTMLSRSDAVLVGEVTSVDKQRVMIDSRSLIVTQLNVIVLEVFSGTPMTHLTLRLLDNGNYYPDWRRPLPHDVTIGSQWLLFLFRKDGHWYPRMGKHGMARVDGNAIVIDKQSPFSCTLGDIRSAANSGARQ